MSRGSWEKDSRLAGVRTVSKVGGVSSLYICRLGARVVAELDAVVLGLCRDFVCASQKY